MLFSTMWQVLLPDVIVSQMSPDCSDTAVFTEPFYQWMLLLQVSVLSCFTFWGLTDVDITGYEKFYANGESKFEESKNFCW